MGLHVDWGTGAPTSTPYEPGQHYGDLSAGVIYISAGLIVGSVTTYSWVQMNQTPALIKNIFTANFIVTNEDVVYANKATAIAGALPDPTTTTRRITFVNVGAGTLTLTGALINGQSNLIINTNDSATLISDGTNWWIS